MFCFVGFFIEDFGVVFFEVVYGLSILWEAAGVIDVSFYL